MDRTPWYRDGLRFRCVGCGACCTGAPGYVWLNKAEIEALMVEFNENEVDRFEKRYVRRIGIRKSLREYANGDCVFFDSEKRRCIVYAARPRQCRSWPFWDSNVRTEQHWADTCEICPGCAKGPLYELGEIERQRQVIRI